MLMFCQIAIPENLWLEFRDAIYDLSVRIPNPTVDRVHDYGLFLLDRVLGESGYSLHNFPKMPIYETNWTLLNGNYLITEQLSYDCDTELQSFQQLMENVQAIPKQHDTYQHIVEAVLARTGSAFFLSRPGGTGKTYVYKTVCHRLRSKGKIVLCVASSSIAALLLPGGRTAHSMFHIPIDNLDTKSLCNISNTKPLSQERINLLQRRRS